MILHYTTRAGVWDGKRLLRITEGSDEPWILKGAAEALNEKRAQVPGAEKKTE